MVILMAKTNNKGMGAIAAALLIFAAIFGLVAWNQGWFTTGQAGGDGGPGAIPSKCPDTGYTDFIPEVYNMLNTTGSETYDNTGYLLRKGTDGTWKEYKTITDTTDPTAVDIECGYQYKFCLVASDSDGGDNSLIKEVIKGGTLDSSDGCVFVEATGADLDLKVKAEQHDVLTFRVWDKVDARYAYDSGDADNTVFEADGTTFRDGDNATAFVVGAGGYLDFRIEMKGADADQDFQDGYTLVLVEVGTSATATYETPDVRFEGSPLADIKTSLTPEEQAQFSAYDWVFKIPATNNIRDTAKYVDFYIKAKAGQNPSTDVEVDFATAGNYLSADGVSIKHGAAKDDSSYTVTYTVQDVTIDIS